jgi:predicted esterase
MPPTIHTIATTTHGRYLVEPPADGNPAGALVGFHGYGQHAGHMLDDLRAIAGSDRWLLVSVQGLHRFYDRNEGVVASWMTREDRELAIEDNGRYVGAVVAAVNAAFVVPALVYVGFSQGVAMAFRAAARAGHACDGVVALGGDIPPDVRDDPDVQLPNVIIGGGRRDRYYPPEKLAADAEWLGDRGVLAASVDFDGGHEWSDTFRHAAAGFLASRVKR